MQPGSRTVLSLCSLVVTFASIALGQDQAQPPAPLAASPAAGTTVPRLISFSGVIKTADGKPVTGSVPATFTLYADQEGGSPLWSETQVVQADSQGRYAVFLGATDPTGLPLEVFTTGAARWLDVQVPAAAELPRMLLVGVPYALKAADADTLGGKPLSAFVTTDSQGSSAAASPSGGTPSVPAKNPASQTTNTPAAVGGSGTTDFVALWTSSTTLGNSGLFQTVGNIGLGTTAPGGKLEVDGSAVGIKASTTGTSGIAVIGNATATTGQTFGIQGNSSSSSGIAILGNALAKSGSTIGILGQSASSTGTAGVFNNTAGGNILTGLNDGALKFKVDGSGDVSAAQGSFLPTKTGAAALVGTGGLAPTTSTSVGGSGVIATGGSANSTSSQSTVGGTGVVATGGNGNNSAPNYSAGGVGVVATGGSNGVGGGAGIVAQGGEMGELDCCGGDGIQTTGGIFGVGIMATGGGPTNSGGVPGVMAVGGKGVPLGPSDGPGVMTIGGDGIDAMAEDSSYYAGSFTGNVTISGSLSVSGTKSFRIDHPLDPANKYLYHASIESSEVLNLYSGNVILGADGTATVQLPDWFETLNKDFRYQLTAIGGAAPNLHIAQEIQNQTFKIGGGTPGMKVSWQVSAVRQDAWEKAHPMIVEAAKPQSERGYYLNPELFNAPPERSIDWARNPQMMKRMKAEQQRAKSKQLALASTPASR